VFKGLVPLLIYQSQTKFLFVSITELFKFDIYLLTNIKVADLNGKIIIGICALFIIININYDEKNT